MNISNNRALDLIEAALEIEKKDAFEAGQLGFMPRVLVQTTMPYRDTGQQFYKRTNGKFSLAIMSPHGVPFGSVPRHLVAYLASAAVKTKSPEISLGNSQNDFFRLLGMATAGGDQKRRAKEQCKRFFSAVLSLTVETEKNETALANVMVAKRAFLAWNPRQPEQRSLWDSTIMLTNEFFDECVKHPVPIDLRVISALSPSPMAIDVYTWLSWRISICTRISTIPWELLIRQFGSKEGTARRTFVRHFERALKLVETATGASWTPSITVDDDGLTVFPGKPSVRRRAGKLST